MAPFDYIIIGAGSSGGVLANRLSADPKIRVLLIEAGGSGRGLYHALPAGSLVMMGHPKYDWIYHAEPDPSLGGRVVQWAGGKALGGSSSMNGMVYVRGSRFDYDDWAAAGCAGWGFDDVLPYFRKMETFHGPPSQFHGAHGPLSVEPPREMHPAARAFIRAAGELGLPIRDDYTDGDQYGAFECLATLDRGVRCSVRKAYIDEAARRPNVTVLTNTKALDLVIDGGRAVGVRVRRKDGQVETHRAQGEVIVSGGAIQSPAILMRSGIGPAADLQALGIPVVADLPGVGANLQEHGGSGAACRLTTPTYNQQTGPLDMLSHIIRFALFRRGPLTSTAVQALAYFKSDPALAEPDFLFSFIPLAIDYNAKPPKMRDFPGIGVGINLCKPDGRGRIRLRDASPDSKPVIDHQVLGHENDIRRIVIALKTAERLFETEAFKPFVAEQLAPPKGAKTDEDYIAYARSAAGTAYHPVGTCRMGVDADAVVDPRLRVRGVAGLRVVDASIMPRITSGNTNAPAIMIGERAADLILADRMG